MQTLFARLSAISIAALLSQAPTSQAATYTWQGGFPATPFWAFPLNLAGSSLPVSADDTVLLMPNVLGPSQNDLGNNFRINRLVAFDTLTGIGAISGQSLRMSGANAEIRVGTVNTTLALSAQLTGNTA